MVLKKNWHCLRILKKTIQIIKYLQLLTSFYGNFAVKKYVYRTRASINRSQLVTAPLNFCWKNNFLCIFYVTTSKPNKYFLVNNRGQCWCAYGSSIGWDNISQNIIQTLHDIYKAGFFLKKQIVNWFLKNLWKILFFHICWQFWLAIWD